ncbi:MAG TPA: hypothetical protein PKK68_05050 [Methanothrix soehngenii]|nr:hypothetical protein [Methanothrix soehngenii]
MIPQRSLPGRAQRRRAGIRPAPITEDLPLPDGPSTARKRGSFARLDSSLSTSRLRPKKNSASDSVNAASPRYG